MVRIGILGIGFMGTTHFKAIGELGTAKVTAVCTRDKKKREGDWTGIKGNFGDSGGVHDLTGIHKHTVIDDLINDHDVDLVDICLPSPMHADVAITALRAGKHVLCEKPIALSLKDADRMLDTATQHGKHLMVGQVLRFFPEFALIKHLADAGEYGRIVGAHLKRIISKPE
ncbi:MAG: Gfo/Idh/MocA family oxidoreductase, partial [Candidatus Latescibacteria bacterium]|nr:Gfo/Idh/MocA family oxidoreductase [Candidatus Latescibacterota bacterium]